MGEFSLRLIFQEERRLGMEMSSASEMEGWPQVLIEAVLDALWEKALEADAVPWNDASGDYPEEGEVTEKEREDLEEVFPEYPHPSPCSKT